MKKKIPHPFLIFKSRNVAYHWGFLFIILCLLWLWLQEIHLDSILEAVCAQFEAVVSLEKVAVTRVRQVTTTITKVKEYVTALGRLQLDGAEYALLRAIAIFGAGTHRKSINRAVKGGEFD